MLCKRCGAELQEDARFCTGCGTPVEPEQKQEPQLTLEADAYSTLEQELLDLEQDAGVQQTAAAFAQEPAPRAPDQDPLWEQSSPDEPQPEADPEVQEEAGAPTDEPTEEGGPWLDGPAYAREWDRDWAYRVGAENAAYAPKQGSEPRKKGVRPTEPEASTTMEWLLVLLVTLIPVVNVVLLSVWAFGSNAGPNRRNYARAALILLCVLVALGAFLGAGLIYTIYALLSMILY